MKQRRPSPLPMPIDLLDDLPGMATAPGSVFNAVITLAYLFWRGQCRPLPAEPTELCALVRYAQPRWWRAQPRVLEALATLLPVLQAEYSRRAQGLARSMDGARKGGAISAFRSRRHSSAPAPAGFSDISTATNPTTPRHARPHENNRADLATRAAVVAAKNLKPSNARLSDVKSSPIK